MRALISIALLSKTLEYSLAPGRGVALETTQRLNAIKLKVWNVVEYIVTQSETMQYASINQRSYCHTRRSLTYLIIYSFILKAR